MSDPARWDRQPDETPDAFHHFLIYRDLGPKRSLAKMFNPESGQQNSNKTAVPGHVGKWSSEHSWVERVTAWDAHLQAERDEEARKEARKWERRRQKALESNWQVAQALRAKFDKMMAFPISTQETSEDGKTVVIEPARWTFQSAAMMAKLASEIEAAVLFAAGKDLEDMTDAELRGTAEASLDDDDP